MEIRKTDNTAFKANVFVHYSKAKEGKDALELALKKRFIRKENVLGDVRVSENGHLILDKTTLAARLLDKLVNVKSFVNSKSPLRGFASEQYQAAINDIAKDPATKKIM